MKYKAVIYDIDGVLLNTFDMNFYPLLQIIKEELGKEMTIEEMKPYASFPGMKSLEMLGIHNIEEVYARWVRYVNEYETNATVFDGIKELLESITVDQAIVSSKKRSQYQIDIVNNQLDRFFKCTVLEEDSNKHKPDPEPLLICLDKLGYKSEEVVYIGDMYNDYLASKNAGIDFIYAKWGSNEVKEVNARYIAEKPEDVLKIIGE